MTAARVSSMVWPEGSLADFSAWTSVAPEARAAWATASAKVRKLLSLATKSVSELISTSTALPPSWAEAILPSAATRSAFLSALARPDLRSHSAAASMLPAFSVSAFLHSIMPAPVRSRSSLTREAVISTVVTSVFWVLVGKAHGAIPSDNGRTHACRWGRRATMARRRCAAMTPQAEASSLLRPRRAGLASALPSLNSSSRTTALLGEAALPSSTASAAARAYSCTARMASSLPGMA